jgi:nitroreductase
VSVESQSPSAAAVLYDAIAARRSIARVRLDAPPDRAALERILTAATWAPYHHCAEPWRFVVVAGDARRRLGEVAARTLSVDPALPPEVGVKLQAKEREKFMRAPVVIVVVATAADDPVDVEENYAAGCAATQNLLLAAHAEGLSGYWRTGRLAREPEILRDLGLVEGERVVGLVYLGEPEKAGTRPPGVRVPASEKTTWLD